jgi:hypothetical protein
MNDECPLPSGKEGTHFGLPRLTTLAQDAQVDATLNSTDLCGSRLQPFYDRLPCNVLSGIACRPVEELLTLELN